MALAAFKLAALALGRRGHEELGRRQQRKDKEENIFCLSVTDIEERRNWEEV